MWSSGPVEPEFPTPPEATWQPLYQKLRGELAARGGHEDRWTCFSSGPLRDVIGFYAGRYQLDPAAIRVVSRPAGEVFSTVRKVSAELGHPVPVHAAGLAPVRSATLAQRGALPMVILESPYLDLATGRVRPGTLISMRWRSHP